MGARVARSGGGLSAPCRGSLQSGLVFLQGLSSQRLRSGFCLPKGSFQAVHGGTIMSQRPGKRMLLGGGYEDASPEIIVILGEELDGEGPLGMAERHTDSS